MNITHFTSRSNWRKIKRSGSLEPKSEFVKDFMEEVMVQSLPEITSLKDKLFITAIPTDRLDDWKRYGLFEDIVDYTTGQVKLTFPLDNLEGVFVRDHYSTSTEHSIKIYGTDVFHKQIHPMLARMGVYREQCKVLFKEYMLSSRKISETDLSAVKCPEIWIPFPISLDIMTPRVEPSFAQEVLGLFFNKKFT